MLKLFKYSWKQGVTFGLVVTCLSSLGYCLFKVTHTLLTRPISQYNAGKWSSNNAVKQFTPRTTLTKDMFFLTLNDFLAVTNQVNLEVDKTYFITKTIEANPNNLQCLFGVFRLQKKSLKQLNFSILNTFPGKKMEQYALFNSHKLQYSVLEKDQLPTNILNCKNWIIVENSYKIFEQKNEEMDETIHIPFSKPKCILISSANFIALKADTPNIVYFDYDTIKNKLNMCVKKEGEAIVHIMTLNSAKFKTQYLKIEKRAGSRGQAAG